VEVVRRLKGIELDVRKTPGTQLRNTGTGEVIYTPPEGEQTLRDLLSNWERYLHAEDGVEPLVKLAVQHYQFEAIHPFADGNGRAGRILNVLFLIEQRLLTTPILYLSRLILQERETYYRLLQGVTRDKAWEPWILWLVNGIEKSARETNLQIYALMMLQVQVTERLKQYAPRLADAALVKAIFEQPYVRITTLVERGVAGRQTAARYLGELADLDILEMQRAGRQNIYLNTRMLRVLTSRPPDCDLFDPSPIDPSRPATLQEFIARTR
jgi:Fic family protein